MRRFIVGLQGVKWDGGPGTLYSHTAVDGHAFVTQTLKILKVTQELVDNFSPPRESPI